MANLYRADEFVKTVLGAAIPGAQLFWCTQPANVSSYPPSPLAVAFSDPNGFVPLTFPVLTDGFGHGDVYLNAGLYTLVVAFGGVISQIYPDQSVGGVGTNSGAGTALSLQINGAPSSNQLLQNLVGQNSVAVTDAGNGTVNITGAVFQTNGVANAVQSKQNLIAGTNITLTADGAGGTTIAAAGGGSSGVQTATITLTAVQLAALRATPVTVVAGQAGKTIVPIFYELLYNFGGTPYSGVTGNVFNLFPGTSITLSWDNGIQATNFVDQSSNKISFAMNGAPNNQQAFPAPQAPSSFQGQALSIGFGANQGAAPLSAGNGTVTVIVNYIVT
jgi:hypothetical protein